MLTLAMIKWRSCCRLVRYVVILDADVGVVDKDDNLGEDANVEISMCSEASVDTGVDVMSEAVAVDTSVDLSEANSCRMSVSWSSHH